MLIVIIGSPFNMSLYFADGMDRQYETTISYIATVFMCNNSDAMMSTNNAQYMKTTRIYGWSPLRTGAETMAAATNIMNVYAQLLATQPIPK